MKNHQLSETMFQNDKILPKLASVFPTELSSVSPGKPNQVWEELVTQSLNPENWYKDSWNELSAYYCCCTLQVEEKGSEAKVKD